MGYCIRDDAGNIIATDTLKCGQQPIIVAEANGLQEGVRAAVNLGLNNLEIESDNICIVRALKKEWTTPCEISSIILDTLEDLQRCKVVQIRHCFRKVNMVAVSLAKSGTLYNARED